MIALLSGYVSTKTILIPPGEPVQLAEPVKAHIFVDVDGRRVRSDNTVTLPAGWWCLPLDEEKWNFGRWALFSS